MRIVKRYTKKAARLTVGRSPVTVTSESHMTPFKR